MDAPFSYCPNNIIARQGFAGREKCQRFQLVNFARQSDQAIVSEVQCFKCIKSPIEGGRLVKGLFIICNST